MLLVPIDVSQQIVAQQTNASKCSVESVKNLRMETTLKAGFVLHDGKL